MAESPRESQPGDGADRAGRSSHQHAVTSGNRPQPAPHDSEPFIVGFGECAGVVDRVEVVSSPPAPVHHRKLAGYRFPETVGRLRDRASANKTGQPLPVRLDRGLLLPAHRQHRGLLEDDIRAMHGIELRDGRTLRVDEVLGRYGNLAGGTHQQLLEIGHRLSQGQLVRLAVSADDANDEIYRQLGALRHRYGHQLKFHVAGKPRQRDAFRLRLVRGIFLARIALSPATADGRPGGDAGGRVGQPWSISTVANSRPCGGNSAPGSA